MQQYQLIARWLKGHIPGKILPWQIDLDTTNICNQACYYCNTELFRKDNPVFQPVEKYIQLIEDIYNWRSYDPTVIGTTSNVIFSGGGEPTLLPGYEQIIETAIDKGFCCAMNTNGTKLDKLLRIPFDKIKRMAYIGLDIDSGNPETYEIIRRSRMKSPFSKVKELATEFGSIGAPIDIKALLMPENSTEEEIHDLFQFAKDVNARGLHFRPVIIDSKTFNITSEVINLINKCSIEYQISANISMNRLEDRTYNKCHQFFLFPSFCADGNIYLCCEYKGRPEFKLASWTNSDWRDIWCSESHKKIYQSFNTLNCKMCRPNPTNNLIENDLKDDMSVLKGFI